MTGGEVLVTCLKQEGVKFVHGIPGDQLYPVLDAIYNEETIDFVSYRHEQSAANAADAWARVTGNPGICLGTVGPGAANLIPGVYSAWADSIPIIVICAQNQTWNIYPNHGMTQDLDQINLFKPITKWQCVLYHWKRIPELVQWAFRAAISGRPGPVLIDCPSDVLFAKHDIKELNRSISPPKNYRSLKNPVASPDQIEKAVELLLQAKNPLIHVGGGSLAAKASNEIQNLAEYLQIPVTSSVFARGVIPDDHPLLILPASYGAIAAQASADIVLLIGGRLGDTDFWGRPPAWNDYPAQKVIQIDIDPQNIGLNKMIELGLVGDAQITTKHILSKIKEKIPKSEPKPIVDEYKSTQDVWLKDFLELGQSDQIPIHPLRAIKEIRDFFPRNAISIVDGGNTAIWAHYLNRIYKPNTFLWPSDSGHLGVGLGYSIGSKLAKPDRKVYAIMGDGSFMFNVQELETARRLNLSFVICVLNDRAYGMIKAGQKIAYNQRYIGVDFFDVRYDAIAQAIDCFGIRVTEPKELRPALEKADASGVPAVLDIVVDREINLEPPDFATLAAVWLEGCLD
ncbi:MAG: thiamine pyrophosphate-binding protein [Candidatus Hodarchaeota archaeon]